MKKNEKQKVKFVEVTIKDNDKSLMECGSTAYCNENKWLLTEPAYLAGSTNCKLCTKYKEILMM